MYDNFYCSIVQDYYRIKNLKVVVYGNTQFTINYARKLKLFGIHIAYILSDALDCSMSTEFLIKAPENVFLEHDIKIIVCDLNWKRLSAKLFQLGVCDLNVSYFMEKFQMRLSRKYCIDPLLGQTLHRVESTPGYVVLKTNKRKDKKYKIVVLGGDSNSEIYCHRQKMWAESLSRICDQKGLDVTFYCGGNGGNSTILMLLKLIRDIYIFKEDNTIVLHFGGRRDYAQYYLWKYNFRYVGEWQQKFFDSIVRNKDLFPPTSLIEPQITYGLPKQHMDAFSFWEDQLKLLNAVCSAFHLKFYNFLDHDAKDRFLEPVDLNFGEKEREENALKEMSQFEKEIYLHRLWDVHLFSRDDFIKSVKEYKQKCLYLSSKYSWCHEILSFYQKDISSDLAHLNTYGSDLTAREIYNLIQDNFE